MSDTPETDKAEDDWRESWSRRSGRVEMAAIARKLERERDAAYNAIRFASARFDRIKWGCDGDCGSNDIMETLEGILPK